jgi:hypothetical protein
MQAPTAGAMPPSDSEEDESDSEESDSEEEQPARRPKPAVPDEPPKKYDSPAYSQ